MGGFILSAVLDLYLRSKHLGSMRRNDLTVEIAEDGEVRKAFPEKSFQLSLWLRFGQCFISVLQRLKSLLLK
jgi:hypothetical protein